jgi:short subunit dehydrogenase-like uncharacterized protein
MALQEVSSRLVSPLHGLTGATLQEKASQMNQWMIYGANGYTGRLMAAEAVRRGMTPILAGRNEEAVRNLAEELGLDYRVFDLNDKDIVSQLADLKLVMHCAGPFSATSQLMIDACLSSKTHYLDITGEISVFESAWKQSDKAKQAGIVLCPGAGFDVVPTDCLAALLVKKLPDARSLQLAFEPGGNLSPGTAKTSVEGLANGGCVRRDGKLVNVPLAWKSREIPFRHGKRNAVTIPWGDVFTAWVSTGIPDIEVYISVPPSRVKSLRRLRLIQPLLRTGFVQSFLKKRIESRVSGPDQQSRSATRVQLWGEVVNADGRSVSATMETPDGYELTVTAGLGMVSYLLEKDVEGGYTTPSLLMGPDYAASLPGVSLQINS